MCLAALPQLFLWKLGDLGTWPHCSKTRLSSRTLPCWLFCAMVIRKTAFLTYPCREKNSQDNFWKKKKRQDRDASLLQQPCYETSLGLEQELDFVAVNPPLEGPLWHCCLHQKPSLPTWESERRAGATPPGCSWAAEFWRLPSLQEKQAGGCTAWPVGVCGSRCLLQFRKKKKKATFS